jgi:hypothetical protein
MRKRASGSGRSTPVDGARFDHSSKHADLKSLVEDHLLDAEHAAVTAKWYPSRRGNSPKSAPKAAE